MRKVALYSRLLMWEMRDGTEEGYQDTDLFVDESVDTAEQAIQNLLLEDLHQKLY